MSCPLYHVHRDRVESNEITASRQPSIQIVAVPYCVHVHSPAPRDLINAIGGGTRLHCGGDLARCQVPESHR
jgi:hypothetical protein